MKIGWKANLEIMNIILIYTPLRISVGETMNLAYQVAPTNALEPGKTYRNASVNYSSLNPGELVFPDVSDLLCLSHFDAQIFSTREKLANWRYRRVWCVKMTSL